LVNCGSVTRLPPLSSATAGGVALP